MTATSIRIIAALLLTISLGNNAFAQLKLPRFFGNHMVLQRDAKVPIWGTAAAGANVKVTFADQTVSATTNKEGVWKLMLAPLAASKETRTLSVEANGKKVVVEDVLVGDVWLGSGQSNMAGRVASYAKNDETLAALAKKAPFAQIRLMQGGPVPTWTEANADAVNRFSAIHFAFGERLQRELDVPVGLIVGAVGGTTSGSWIPAETYAKSQRCKAVIAEFAKTYDIQQAEKQYKAKLAVFEKRAAEAKAAGKKVRGRKPQPPKKPGESTRGGKVGNLYQRFIKSVAGYRIRGVLWDQGEARSGVLGVDQHTMMSELIRGWREEWAQGEFPFIFVQKPSGGGNAFTNENPITRNGDKFSAAVPDINRIGSGDQRFLYVRLMQDNSNAWMVPASDLGSGIHPSNKWGYGNRAAEVALSQVYKTGIQAYGPIYKSHKVDGNKVIIAFDQVGKGLTAAHNDKLNGFAIAGKDGQWQWAEAKIEGDAVVIWSDKISEPTRIRYAFAQRREWANLFNKDGLPALAFEAGP